MMYKEQSQNNKIDLIQYLHSELKQELALTQDYIITFSKSNDKIANRSINHIIRNKGKMLRPILLILSGKYSFHVCNSGMEHEDRFTDDIAKAAAILELIQMSSLVHDDVIDQSMERRKKPTLNNLRGNRFAVLLGDYLVAQSLSNCYSLVYKSEHYDSIILMSFLEGISKLVLGEVQQNNLNNNQIKGKSEIDCYFEIIENKTASLFSLATLVGSSIGNKASEQTMLLSNLGKQIGIVYQIIDDLRDFSVDVKISGEKSFQDITYGVKTLPYILALNSSLNGELDVLKNFFNTRREPTLTERQNIIDILINSESIQNSLTMAEAHIEQARNILGQLTQNRYLTLMAELVDYLSTLSHRITMDIKKARLN